MSPLQLLLILLCTLICLVTSAPSVQIDHNEPSSQHSLNYDIFPFSWSLNHPLDSSSQPEHHFTVGRRPRKPRLEYLNDNGGEESSLNNPTFQWHPYSFNHIPQLNLPSFRTQTMLPFPKFRLQWPTFRPFAPMDKQNFPTLPPLSEMGEENFPSLPLFPSKDKPHFPTLPPRNGPNNFPTLPPRGPFPTLPPLPPLPTRDFPNFPPLPRMNFPTLPPFTLLGKQNNEPKNTPFHLEDSLNFEESSSTKKPYETTEDSQNCKELLSTKKLYDTTEDSQNFEESHSTKKTYDTSESFQNFKESLSSKKSYDTTEESVIMKIIFPNTKEDGKEEPYYSYFPTQNIPRGNNETEGINALSHIFRSFVPIDALTNVEAINASESFQNFKESLSLNKSYDTTEESVIMKIIFSNVKEDGKEEPYYSYFPTQNIPRGNNETEGINALSHIFRSFVPIDALTNVEAINALTDKEVVPLNDSLLDQEVFQDISVLGVPLKCSKGRCFCPHLHYYDNHSGRCLHQNSVWTV